MSVERHDIHHDDVAAYLLGALDRAEEQRFELHLEECPICQDELGRLRPAVDALPRSVWPVSPPASLKAALMAAAAAEVGEREGAAGRRVSGRRRALAPVRGWFTVRRNGVVGVRPAVAWVSAFFLLLTGVLAGYGATDVIRGDDEKARTVAATPDKTRVPFVSGSLVVGERLEDGAVLRVHGLPDLEADSVYQVWMQRDGEVISQSLFTVGEDGEAAAAVADDLEGADAVLVTRERAGGAKAPSEKPILSVRL